MSRYKISYNPTDRKPSSNLIRIDCDDMDEVGKAILKAIAVVDKLNGLTEKQGKGNKDGQNR